jgi:hypothetical protein
LAGPSVLGESARRARDRGEDVGDRLSEDLTKNPAGFLKDIGARFLPERSIRTLYRVRHAALITAAHIVPIAVTLAYPIYIIAASQECVAGDLRLYDNRAVAVEMSKRRMREERRITEDFAKALRDHLSDW